MFDFLKSLFFPDPEKVLIKEISRLREQAFQLQRNGDLRGCGKITEKAERLERELEELEKK